MVTLLPLKDCLLVPLVLVGLARCVVGVPVVGGFNGSTDTDYMDVGGFSAVPSSDVPDYPKFSTGITLNSLTSLCYAMCMAKCLDTQARNGNTNATIGFYDTNIRGKLTCIPKCVRYKTTGWMKLCQQNDTTCLEKCHNLRNHTVTEERVPNVPQLSLQQPNPYLVELSWPPPVINSTVFYVIENSDDNGLTWDFTAKTSNSSLLVPLDVCSRRRYRAASVSRYGSHGFQADAEATRNKLPIPSPIRGLTVISKIFDREDKIFHVNVQWDPPQGWKPPDVREYRLFYSMDKYCKDTLVPSTPIVDSVRPVGNENNTMLAKIRIYEMGYGCVYRTPMNAVSKCGIHGEYVNLDIDISDCNEIPGYDCPTFPLTGPGSVMNASCSQQNGSVDLAIFNCTWLPPSDLGTFNRVDTYVIQWGLLSHMFTTSSMKELGRATVSGNVTEYELHFNMTSIANRSAILCGVKIMPTVKEIQMGKYALYVRPVDTTFRPDDQREYGDKEKDVRATEKSKTDNTNTQRHGAYLQKTLYISLPLGGALVLLAVFTILQGARVHRARNAASRRHELFKLAADNIANKQYLVDNPLYTSSDPWEIPRNRLVLGEVLGKGAFGQVVMADLVNGSEVNWTQVDDMPTTKVAVKMLLEGADDSLTNDFEREIELMKTIGPHPNVVSMLGCCTQTAPLCLVVEYMMTDLLHFLRRRRHARLENVPTEELLCLKDLLSFGRQIAVGMEYLSQKGFVHRDLAARNVLVGDGTTVTCKIGDFGLTRYVYDDHVYVTKRGKRLPLKWMAIEAIHDLIFTTQTDVWAFGVVLYELVTLGRAPYPTTANRDLLRRLQLGYRMGRPEACPPQLYDVMLSCWEADPADRPSFTDLRATLEALMEQETTVDYITICVDKEDDDITSDDITSDLDASCSDVGADDGVVVLSDDEEDAHDDVFVLDGDSCSDFSFPASSRRSSNSSRGPPMSDSSGVSSYHVTSICLGTPPPGDELLLVPGRLGLTLPGGKPSSPIPIQGQSLCHRRSREQSQVDEGPAPSKGLGQRVVGKRQDLLRVSTCSQDRLLSSSFSEGFCSDDGRTLSHCSETQI